MDAFDSRKPYLVRDLLQWKSFSDSLSIFASVNFFFLLLTVYEFPLASLLAYLLLGYVACLYGLQLLGYKINTEDDYEFVSREVVEAVLSTTHKQTNALLKQVANMGFDETFVQVLLGLFLGVYLAGMFSLAGFLWLVAFLAFTLPPVYAMNEGLVSAQVGAAKEAYTKYREAALRSIPRAKSLQS